MGLSEACRDAVNSHFKPQGFLAWYKADLIKRSRGEQSWDEKSRDINDWRSASRVLSQLKHNLPLSSMDLFSVAWSVGWRLLGSAVGKTIFSPSIHLNWAVCLST